jgi:hypothetical protein
MSCLGIRSLLAAPILSLCLYAGSVMAESRNLAPGFSAMNKGAVISIMQPDVELFSLSAGGVSEPKADWTEAATKHISAALDARFKAVGVATRTVTDSEADDLAEINALHAAVARSISLHHMGGDSFSLPTKEGKLDWSMGDAVIPLREKTGADYALFLWVRDSYASAERKVAMVALALLGVGITGGFQIGYSSLVDLRTGQVLWFNQMFRGNGDLREAEPAAETIAALLKNFPESQ